MSSPLWQVEKYSKQYYVGSGCRSEECQIINNTHLYSFSYEWLNCWWHTQSCTATSSSCLPISQTCNSSITLHPQDAPNPKIDIHNLQILSKKYFQDGVFLNPPNQLKYSIRLIIIIIMMFWFSKILLYAFWFSNIFSLCFWQTQPNITHIHSELLQRPFS